MCRWPLPEARSDAVARTASQQFRQPSLSSATLEQVLTATKACDVPLDARKKLYASLNRALQRPGVPAAVLARWFAPRLLRWLLKESL